MASSGTRPEANSQCNMVTHALNAQHRTQTRWVTLPECTDTEWLLVGTLDQIDKITRKVKMTAKRKCLFVFVCVCVC